MTISSQTRKAGPFNGNDVTTAFPFTFKVFSSADVYVVEADAADVESVLVLNSDYTVSLNANQNTNPGGTVTLTNPLATGHTLVVTSSVDYLQPTDLTNQGGFYPKVINDSLDRLTILLQQTQEEVDRSAKLPITSAADADALVADIVLLADNVTPINTVAGIAANVTTVAGISADVTTVAGIAANVTTVAGIAANVTAVAAVDTEVAAVAGIAANVTTVAGIDTEVTTVAGIAASVSAVAAVDTEVTTVAGIAANVTAVAAVDTEVTTVAGIAANVTTVAGIAADVTTVAGVAADTTTVAGIAANVTTVAGIAADVTTAAANVVDITNFADVYIGAAASDPTTRTDLSALVAGDLYFNTTIGRMKVYTGVAWSETPNGSMSVQTFSGTGAQTAFTLAAAPASENNTQVFIGGVYQQKSEYSVSGTTLTFGTAPIVGTNNIEVVTVSTFPMGSTSSDLVTHTPTSGSQTTVQELLRKHMPTAANMTALRALTNTTDSGVVYLKAHTTAGDGGHGEFRWISGAAPATYVDNNGTIIVPTGGDGSAAWLRDYSGALSVKAFGVSTGLSAAAQRAAIQDAIDSVQSVIIDDDFTINAAIYPAIGSRLYFVGGTLTASAAISSPEECLIKVVDVNDVEIHNADLDCGGFAANSGIIVRENTSDIRIFNTKVVDAAWDAVLGGGRAIIVEANTGDTGKIIIDGLVGIDVDTLIGLNGYASERKNAVLVTNCIGLRVEKLIAVFGNGGTYPHTGENQQFLVSNVIGYDVAQPIRFDRAGNTIINNVYVYNSSTYGVTDTVIRGTANNVRCTNVVMEGGVSSLYDATPWDDANGSTDLGFDTTKCHFQITHRGTASDAVLTAGLTRSTLVNSTTFDLNTDVVTGNLVSNTQMRANTSAYVELYSCQQNAKISGFVDEIGANLISAYAGEIRTFFPTGAITPTVAGSSSTGTATYSVQTGSYTKIGGRVFFNAYLSWTGHTGTGNIWIEGFPTSSAASNSQAALSISFPDDLALTASNVVSAYKDVGNGRIVLVQSPVGGGGVSAVPIDAAATIMISGSYPAA